MTTTKTSTTYWAGGFLFDTERSAVFLHRRDSNTVFNPNMWAFFGGLNEGTERPEECFIRELEEETGFIAAQDVPIFLCSYLNEELNTYRYVFYVETDIEKEQLKLGEGADFDWVLIVDLGNYNLTEKTKLDLDTFIKKVGRTD